MRMAGRSIEEWKRRREVAVEFLIERARLERLTSYSELEATILRRTKFEALDFARIDERMAMADMLGQISEWSFHQHDGVMLSALVIYLNENEPGPGFY